MPVRYILSSVWVRLSIFSPLSIIQYVGLYVFSLPISLVMIEIIYILCLIIIIKSEVWTITHCLGLGHETMVCAVCLFVFFLIAHVIIIIIKSEESTFPIVIIFFRGCVPEMFVASYSVTYCIYVPGKPGICFQYHCAVYDECKYSDAFWLADRTRLFVQYTNSLSSLCKLIGRHRTFKMPVRYILSNV